jgi:hypothetical protein
LDFHKTTRKHTPYSLVLLVCFYAGPVVGQDVESFGVFGGLNFPFTIDQGLNKDPRFFGKFSIRGTPVGAAYGYDKIGFGFVVTPQYMQVGQTFLIQNRVGGEVGRREVNMNYFSIPAALKIHMSDLAFFRLSLVASIAPSFLIRGQEVITHEAAKLRYPASVLVPAEPGYSETFDGVFVPAVDKQVYVANNKFNSFNLFAAIGFRSDFEFSENWALNFDGRANFGIFDTRKSSYLDQLRAPDNVPDLFGQRREVFLSLTIGISRTLTIKKDFKPKPTSQRGSSYKSIPYKKLPKPKN